MSKPPLCVRWLGTVGYTDAWALQRQIAEDVRTGRVDDTLLLLEHPAVFTLGRETKDDHIGPGIDALKSLGAEVEEVDRGGSVTFHGPGQLVAYPILKLAPLLPIASEPDRGDVVLYVRTLERALIDVLADHGIAGRCRPPYTGVWVDQGKIAAIGIKLVSGGITLHGVALNLTTDLSWFDRVIPCGIRNEAVASMASIGKATISVKEAGLEFAERLADRLSLELRLESLPRASAPVA